MRFHELREDSAQNINLVKILTKMFIDSVDMNYLKEFVESGRGSRLALDNPYRDYTNYEKLVKIFEAGNFANSNKIFSGLQDLSFVLDLDGYKFSDGENEVSAAGTYISHTNTITFYNIEAINASTVSHEIRHAMQFHGYAFGKSPRKKPYYQRPIEIDAYWTDSVVKNISDYGRDIPYSNDKASIVYLSKNIFRDFNRRISPTEQVKKKYWKKTLKAVYALARLYEYGIELEVKDIRKFLKSIEDNKSNKIKEILAKMDKGGDDLQKQLLKAMEDDYVTMSGIPDYDSTKEKSWNVFREDVPMPKRFNPKYGTFAIGHMMLYLALQKNEKIGKIYKAMVEKSGEDVSSHVYDFVEKQFHDPDNQYYVLMFIRNFFDI
jgi:hypothetical protein